MTSTFSAVSPSPNDPSGATLAAVANPVLRGPVVLAIHGRETSRATLIAAQKLATQCDLEVGAVTVLEPAPAYGPSLDLAPVLQTAWIEWRDAQKESVQKHLREGLGQTPWTLDVREGSIAREIARAAEQAHATIIIVDAAPHRGLRHPVAGVRALQVVRRATCPVLSVGAGFTGSVRRIVAAIDFSPASIRAVQAALLLADDHARLVLVHIPSVLHFERPLRDASGALFGGHIEAWFERLREELRPYASANLHIETRIIHGTVAGEVLGIADALHADLVTVGARAANVIERLFVGSSAAGIVHGAPCSVLVAPAPPPAEFARLELLMSDTVLEKDPGKWQDILDAVSRRDAGRVVTLEVDDPSIGAQMEAQGYKLRGITYDRHDRRIEIMLGDGQAGHAHLTHTIDHPKAVAIRAESAGRDQALEFAHGRGHTLVLFDT